MRLAHEARAYDRESIRPTPIIAETFEGFRILDDGRMFPICERPTFDECLNLAQIQPHKAKIAIRRTNLRTGAVKLHLYAIKQQAQAITVIKDYVPSRVRPLRAEHICDIQLPDCAEAAERDDARFNETNATEEMS